MSKESIQKMYAESGVAHTATYLLSDSEQLENKQGLFSFLCDKDGWDDGFNSLRLPGLSYRGCTVVVSFDWYLDYTNSEDITVPKTVPRISTSVAVMSNWNVSQDARRLFGLGEDTDRLTVYFPMFAGATNDIGRKRRSTGVCRFTPGEEINIGLVSARGGFRLDDIEANPKPREAVYRCALMPGTLYDEYDDDGHIRFSTANTVFKHHLGFTPFQLTEDNGIEGKPMKMFGQIVVADQSGTVVELPFNTELGLELRKVWEQIIRKHKAVR